MLTGSIHFDRISVEGYRGRSFELKMKPRGKHSVFIMDGNTGKTTTIELLRWCFGWRESQAAGKFKHMWNDPAHVLDHNVSGDQTCTISIDFSDLNHSYHFRRVTRGRYAGEKGEKGILIEKDDIETIKDTLEIDNGIEAYFGDDAHNYMNANFRFVDCAEYFCFDGEKAKEVMMHSAKKSEIHLLLDIVNKRVTHHKLEEYRSRLDRLKRYVYNEAKSRASRRPSANAMKDTLDDIVNREEELVLMNAELSGFNDSILSHDKSLMELGERREALSEEIIGKASESLVLRTQIQTDLDSKLEKIEERRGGLYKNCLQWVNIEHPEAIQSVKDRIRESGNLPEPYRQELIKSCLNSDPPVCQICGQTLTDREIARIKTLGELIAPHYVHTFLTASFDYEPRPFDAYAENQTIQELIAAYSERQGEFDRISLSETDLGLVEKKKGLDIQIAKLNSSRARTDELATALQMKIKKKEAELKEIKDKSKALSEYRQVLDKIDETLAVISDTQDKMTDTTIEIISEVISDSVKSILGAEFSAILSRESGLLLGENGVHSTEMGGMSGRLILSYCFAEAVTRIDPIIVDTPSGNIGSVRPELAEHLSANHSQVILLCLPREVDDFADHICDPSDFAVIKNLERRR